MDRWWAEVGCHGSAVSVDVGRAERAGPAIGEKEPRGTPEVAAQWRRWWRRPVSTARKLGHSV